MNPHGERAQKGVKIRGFTRKLDVQLPPSPFHVRPGNAVIASVSGLFHISNELSPRVPIFFGFLPQIALETSAAAEGFGMLSGMS